MSVRQSFRYIFHTQWGGTNIYHTQFGGQTFSTHRGDKHFYTWVGGGNIFVGAGGGGYDVDDHEEEDVSEGNIVMSEVSKLSAGSQA